MKRPSVNVVNFSQPYSHIRWLNSKKTNVSRTIIIIREPVQLPDDKGGDGSQNVSSATKKASDYTRVGILILATPR